MPNVTGFSVFSDALSYITTIYAPDFDAAVAEFIENYDGEDYTNTNLVFVDFDCGRSLVFKVKTSISLETF